MLYKSTIRARSWSNSLNFCPASSICFCNSRARSRHASAASYCLRACLHSISSRSTSASSSAKLERSLPISSSSKAISCAFAAARSEANRSSSSLMRRRSDSGNFAVRYTSSSVNPASLSARIKRCSACAVRSTASVTFCCAYWRPLVALIAFSEAMRCLSCACFHFVSSSSLLSEASFIEACRRSNTRSGSGTFCKSA
ncbi:hypothetical protein D1872_184600 [compost metagenome]